MIYAAFAIYLLLIVFAGIGIYRLWSAMTKPAVVNWLLLPGTVVSEMAYIFGCLITGGEIRRAKLMDSGGGKSKAGSEGNGGKGGKAGGSGGGPSTDAADGVKVVGPIVASLLAIVACGAGILVADSLLGQTVTTNLDNIVGQLPSKAVPKAPPESWNSFWQLMGNQVLLLKATCESWGDLEWSNWRVPLFVYLAACLSIRLAPVKRDIRWTLAAVAVIAIVIGLAGAVSGRFHNLIQDIWPLLTYVWATLLFMLAVTLLMMGIVAFIRAMSGKGGAKG